MKIVDAHAEGVPKEGRKEETVVCSGTTIDNVYRVAGRPYVDVKCAACGKILSRDLYSSLKTKYSVCNGLCRKNRSLSIQKEILRRKIHKKTELMVEEKIKRKSDFKAKKAVEVELNKLERKRLSMQKLRKNKKILNSAGTDIVVRDGVDEDYEKVLDAVYESQDELELFENFFSMEKRDVEEFAKIIDIAPSDVVDIAQKHDWRGRIEARERHFRLSSMFENPKDSIQGIKNVVSVLNFAIMKTAILDEQGRVIDSTLDIKNIRDLTWAVKLKREMLFGPENSQKEASKSQAPVHIDKQAVFIIKK